MKKETERDDAVVPEVAATLEIVWASGVSMTTETSLRKEHEELDTRHRLILACWCRVTKRMIPSL